MNDLTQTILIVEDEEKIASLLADYLEKIGGFATRWLDRGDGVVGSVAEDPPDLILLDLMLPGMNGLDVCKALRANSNVPIIMVTAMVEEIDRLLGLDIELIGGIDLLGCGEHRVRLVVVLEPNVCHTCQQIMNLI